MKNKTITIKGATLMELLTYVTLVALLTLVVTDAVLSLSRSFRATRITRELGNSAIVSFDRMMRSVRSADSLGAGSVWNATSSKLILEYSGTSTTTEEFSLDGNFVLRLKENGEDQGALTSENLQVTSFFLEKSSSGKNTIIQAKLSLRSKEGREEREETFQTAAVMRGAY